MFNSLKSKLGQQPTEDSVSGDFGDIYQDSYDMDDTLETDPESVLNDPQSPVELKQMAIQKIKDRYLKPKEKDE